jgi:hypothetical protein
MVNGIKLWIDYVCFTINLGIIPWAKPRKI